jgi:sugar/nucleoside kinase (ribokinase family)
MHVGQLDDLASPLAVVGSAIPPKGAAKLRPLPLTDVRDTTCAGDAFAAGFIVARNELR